MSTRPARQEGFTLTELSIAMAVFLVFMTLVTPFMVSHLRSALRTADRVDAQQGARAALRGMVRELRQANVLYSNPPTQPTTDSAISFGVDFDGDTSTPVTRVTYYVQGQELRRGAQFAAGAPMALGVESVGFTMFGNNPVFDDNADGVVTGEELDTNANGQWEADELAFVTRIRISLTVASSDEPEDEQAYTAEAFLRNRLAG
ncbi:MAG TPA: prepilin-type N-terminal cleavage/methylation domain-containing protein [Actinomycetota bacterium]|nr:prepilin-type N-terminal cleavage/methylation domain-containing protein [Actinomycetota bacterium]